MRFRVRSAECSRAECGLRPGLSNAPTFPRSDACPLFAYHSSMRLLVATVVLAAGVLSGTGHLRAIDLDVTPEDIDRALAIARGTESERQRFHAPYIKRVDQPVIETVEIVSEFRRVVLLAEERARKGDRLFGYSVASAQQAVGPWVKRLAVKLRVRFHPQNTYVDVPPVEISLTGNAAAQIGVVKEPVLAFPSSEPGARVPILGAVVEGVFDAVLVGNGIREFVVAVNGSEAGRFSFDLAALQ